MSMKSLREAVKKAKRDTFEEGTVIRWLASDRYLYAAMKTPVGWFTTARDFNTFVPQVVKFDELLEILAKAEVTDVAVSTEWTPVTGGK